MFWPKLLWSGALLLLTVVCCVAPFFIMKRIKSLERTKVLMGYMNSLAGGVVLGALLMHMIPELMPHDHHHHGHKPKHGKHGHGHGHEHKPKHDHGHKHEHDYPWGPLAAGISFLILFAIDHIMMSHDHSGGHAHTDQKAHSHHEHKHHDHHHEHGEACNHEHHEVIEACDHENDKCIDDNACTDECCDHCSIDIPTQSTSPVPLIKEAEKPAAEDCHSHDLMGGCHMDGFTSSATQSQTVIFILALSLHSFLEGLGLGSKKDHGSLVSFLVSLFAHKWLEAFALGVAVLRAKYSSTRTFILLTLYSALTPLGMIGSVMLKGFLGGHAKGSKVGLVLDGLAAGSFLFVSCIEMIPPEFHQRDWHSKFKFLMLTLGFAFMAFIQKFHSH